MLLDSLYPCEDIIKSCEKYKFKYIISIKPIFLQIADFIFLFMTYSFTKENKNLGYKTFGALLNFYKEIRESFLPDIIEFGEINSIKQMRLITPLPSNKSA